MWPLKNQQRFFKKFDKQTHRFDLKIFLNYSLHSKGTEQWALKYGWIWMVCLPKCRRALLQPERHKRGFLKWWRNGAGAGLGGAASVPSMGEVHLTWICCSSFHLYKRRNKEDELSLEIQNQQEISWYGSCKNMGNLLNSCRSFSKE